MEWVTTRRLRINRAATVWLIRRFIDPAATFRFVDESEIAEAERRGAIGFHASGARYPKRDARGRVSFEALVEEHCPGDGALARMARIIHDADVPPIDRAPEPEAPGVRLVTVSFPSVAASDDEIVEKSAFLYDALYAGLSRNG
jgi:hypothetical protein